MSEVSQIVNEAVCVRFGVSESELYGRRTSAMANAARGYAWLLLHEQYGWSVRRLSLRYDRKVRTVWSQLSKYKYLVCAQSGYGSAYSELSARVEEVLSEAERR